MDILVYFAGAIVDFKSSLKKDVNGRPTRFTASGFCILRDEVGSARERIGVAGCPVYAAPVYRLDALQARLCIRCSGPIRVEARFRRAVYTKVPTSPIVDVHCRSVHDTPSAELTPMASEDRVAPQTKAPRSPAGRQVNLSRLFKTDRESEFFVFLR